jgi:glycosyltransferase involved in cell wall biosynthesis
MRTIVFPFLNSYARTGGHKRYLALADDLARRGHLVYVIKNTTLDVSFTAARTVELPTVFDRGVVPFSLRFDGAIRRYRRRLLSEIGTADFVMVYGETHLLAGRRLKRLLGARLFYNMRSNAVAESDVYISLGEPGLMHAVRLRLHRFRAVVYERISARWADVLAFQSRFDIESFLSRVPGARAKAIRIPGNIGQPRLAIRYRDINRSSELSRIAYVGGFGKRKGTWYLVEAIRILHDRGIGLYVRFIGNGTMREDIVRFAHDHGLADRVKAEGRVEDPLPEIGRADLLVVPSLFDSFPNTVLEALHTGTPVIGSRVGGISEILQHDELLFPPGSAEAIADRIQVLCEDRGAYQRAKELCAGRREEFIFDWVGCYEEAMRDRL